MIVSDRTTLIILFDMGKIELLSNIFRKVYIPHSVYEEINFKKGVVLPDFMEVVQVETSEHLNTLQLILDLGESEAIALAKEKSLPLMIDEKKGRKIAQNLDIKIIGLLGVLYLNIKKDFLTKHGAKIFLKSAIENGYRISEKLIDEMMESL